MPKIIDRTGERFGKLLVLGLAGKRKNDKTVFVQCDCGVKKEMIQSRLTQKTKAARSCGCGVLENHLSTHNLTKHPFYHVWTAMKSRCYKEKNASYHRYGGRGIKVCDEWVDSPETFIQWLESHNYGPGLQIDREDNNGDYSPDNCRITTPKANSNNRRDNVIRLFRGEWLTIAQISDKTGEKYSSVYYRYVTNQPYNKEALNL